MKLWIDDIRPAPAGWTQVRTVALARIHCIFNLSDNQLNIEEISLDHDAGEFAKCGGDYIQFLNWLEEMQNVNHWNVPTIFHIHSKNPVGVQNMRTIIEKNNWNFS